MDKKNKKNKKNKTREEKQRSTRAGKTQRPEPVPNEDIQRFQFTVIAGKLKGRKVTTPNFGNTRPPLSRLRKAIFDFLSRYLDGANYLDLFSGTGSYLFEAVSRHVARAVGVELDQRLTNQINKQAKRFEIEERLICLSEDVLTAIPHLSEKGTRFDIVMLAPPQYQGLINKTLALMVDHNILAADGMVLCQHDTSETDDIKFSGFELLQRRKYGNTTFTVLTPVR